MHTHDHLIFSLFFLTFIFDRESARAHTHTHTHTHTHLWEHKSGRQREKVGTEDPKQALL